MPHMPPSLSKSYPTWFEVNLDAVEYNTREMLRQTGNVALLAVVKANAYGMGAVECGKAILRAGGTGLAVARYCEAHVLRQAGITCPILIFGMLAPDEVDAAIAEDLTLTLHSSESAELYSQRAHAAGTSVKVHLKVDTGMGRMGVFAHQAGDLTRQALSLGGIEIDGVYTHFAMVDDVPNDPFLPEQLSYFAEALAGVRAAGVEPRWIHAANSAASVGYPQARFNMTRAGSTLLGIRPFYYAPFPPEFRRAQTWKCQLASCREMPEGWTIGYGRKYSAHAGEWIGVLPVGYADGFRRTGSPNTVLVNGRRLPIVGSVCADMCMVSLPEYTPPGTEVVLMGEQGAEHIWVEDLADRWQTSMADVTANINLRVPRVYVRE